MAVAGLGIGDVVQLGATARHRGGVLLWHGKLLCTSLRPSSAASLHAAIAAVDLRSVRTLEICDACLGNVRQRRGYLSRQGRGAADWKRVGVALQAMSDLLHLRLPCRLSWPDATLRDLSVLPCLSQLKSLHLGSTDRQLCYSASFTDSADFGFAEQLVSVVSRLRAVQQLHLGLWPAGLSCVDLEILLGGIYLQGPLERVRALGSAAAGFMRRLAAAVQRCRRLQAFGLQGTCSVEDLRSLATALRLLPELKEVHLAELPPLTVLDGCGLHRLEAVGRYLQDSYFPALASLLRGLLGVTHLTIRSFTEWPRAASWLQEHCTELWRSVVEALEAMPSLKHLQLETDFISEKQLLRLRSRHGDALVYKASATLRASGQDSSSVS